MPLLAGVDATHDELTMPLLSTNSSRLGRTLALAGAVALASTIVIAPGVAPATATASRAQQVQLSFHWQYATGLGDGDYRAEIIESPFCFPSYDAALTPDWWYRSALTMQADGTLNGSCSDNPDYAGFDPTDQFTGSLTGSLDLAAVHPITNTSSYGGPISWQMLGEHNATTPLGTISERLGVTADEPEGWFPASDGAHDVPDGGTGTAAFTYSCEVTGQEECDHGAELAGTVEWFMDFTEPQEGGQTCTPNGQVFDASGQPVVGVEMWLNAGSYSEKTATDQNGFYEFAPIGGAVTTEFNPVGDQVRVSLALREAAHSPGRYNVYHRQRDAVINAPGWVIAERPDCAQDFDFRTAPPATWLTEAPQQQWPDLVQIYQGIAHAWALADRLGQELTYGLPLKIYAFCDDPQLDCKGQSFAFSVNTTSNRSNVVAEPYIAFGPTTSTLASAGWPDNREYHEFGHYFLAAAFDGMPDQAGDTNHWGYKNASSTDSWTEGFAEWYSAMVSEYIDGRADYNVYRVGRTFAENLRDPIPAWTIEELAIASLLTTIEVNPSPPASTTVSLEVTGFSVVTDPSFGPLLVGSVKNAGTRTARAVRLQATPASGTWSRFGFSVPRDLEPGRQGAFVMLVPEASDPASIGIVASETAAAPVLPQALHVGLQEMWNTITGFVSSNPGSNGRLFDVEDLYHAFKQKWGGADVAASGLDSVDRMFVRHGFYDNSAHAGVSEFAYDSTETIGVTSHPAFGIPASPAEPCEELMFCSPARAPRTDLEPPPMSTAKIDLGGLVGVVYLQVDYPLDQATSSYGTSGVVADDGTVAVPVPPPGSGATVTLIALADKFAPRVLGTIAADDYWTRAVASGGASFLTFAATLDPGDFVLPDLAGGSATAPSEPPATTIDTTLRSGTEGVQPDTTDVLFTGVVYASPNRHTTRDVTIALVIALAMAVVVIRSRHRSGPSPTPQPRPQSGPWLPPHPS